MCFGLLARRAVQLMARVMSPKSVLATLALVLRMHLRVQQYRALELLMVVYAMALIVVLVVQTLVLMCFGLLARRAVRRLVNVTSPKSVPATLVLVRQMHLQVQQHRALELRMVVLVTPLQITVWAAPTLVSMCSCLAPLYVDRRLISVICLKLVQATLALVQRICSHCAPKRKTVPMVSITIRMAQPIAPMRIVAT